jgi:hypothetical protein
LANHPYNTTEAIKKTCNNPAGLDSETIKPTAVITARNAQKKFTKKLSILYKPIEKCLVVQFAIKMAATIKKCCLR